MSEDRCGGIAPHAHGFDSANPLAERRTLWVLILTAITMVLEIVAGWWYGSMALLADGWHMSSHVIALGLAVAAYVLARRLRRDDRFAFGTWKIEVLGGYTSALLLVGVVLYMAFECLSRLRTPGTDCLRPGPGRGVPGTAGQFGLRRPARRRRRPRRRCGTGPRARPRAWRTRHAPGDHAIAMST